MPGGEPFGLLVDRPRGAAPPGAQAPTDDVAAIAGPLRDRRRGVCDRGRCRRRPRCSMSDEFADLAMTCRSGIAAAAAAARALAQSGGTRRHALRLRVSAARRWPARPGRTIRHAPTGSAMPNMRPERSSRVWMSAGYPFAAVVARAFANHAWPADIRGIDTDREGGGVVTAIAGRRLHHRSAPCLARAAARSRAARRAGAQLMEAGLMPLTGAAVQRGRGVRVRGQPAAAAATYSGPTREAANANARISSQVNAMLCASRFAHYIKVIGRDMVGSLETAERDRAAAAGLAERLCQRAINAGPETPRAAAAGRRPGRRCSERLGRPGVFGCTIQLQPHFQLDDVAATFRLVTEVAAPGQRG